ncbi:hypothetical protein AAFF_G00378730 [Aldrovandia affinis]|uniref:P/Homo B domain-containing protein n=1 Tax=Aldrovandia affinis TaxID=143900 RepID=A0AAD7SHI3_9TELE|nr:hypothetical protein AAFF_G00378730 [Aldrovandia affinis]
MLKAASAITIEIPTKACAGDKSAIRSLEHVQMEASIEYTRRGDLRITLTSPSGTSAVLLTERERDTSSSGFRNWDFMSVHTWGEDPRGTWTLTITDVSGRAENEGWVIHWRLILHGTLERPEHMKEERVYEPYNTQFPTGPHTSQKAQASPGSSSGDTVKHATLIQLLKSIFNKRPSPIRKNSIVSHAPVPYQDLYLALDMINKHRGSVDSLFGDYDKGFYHRKPQRHQDRRLMQLLTDMLMDER